ncbi:hypothetical protein HDV01_003946 [Terramyces sp. JEL0728]|nr:hypothetical protein HDV01_003946 [Terramyces sp. JEL0728]
MPPRQSEKLLDPNLFSYISASWLNPLLNLSKNEKLDLKDLPRLHERDTSVTISKKFDKFWDQLKKSQQDASLKKPSMHFVLFSAIGSSFAGNVIATMLGKRNLLINDGYVLAAVLKSLLSCGIYRKSLNLSLESRAKYSEGTIMNFINQDIQAIIMSVDVLGTTVVLPPQVVFTLYMLYILLGKSAAISLVIVGFVAIITLVISPKIGKTYSGWIQGGDKRLSILREMLYSINVIKYETMEEYFKSKIKLVRDNQVDCLRKAYVYWSTLEVSVTSSVLIMTAATFAVYSLLGNAMDSAVIFPAILYFSKLEAPLEMMSWVVSSNIAGIQSLCRISDYMIAEEVVSKESSLSDGSITAHKASFSFAKTEKDVQMNETTPLRMNPSMTDTIQEKFKLKDIQLDIKPGTTVGVVGAVGAGKSTLLSSIIGEVNLERGRLNVNGTIAYCNQQPWIMTGSLEKNILFNAARDDERLNRVVNMCDLQQDLSSFANGLNTEIGENGVNLSGGQKARVALARAIYSDADIYLLDDPLAALDAHVGKRVFKNAIKGLLGDKTVVLVTHQLQYLNQLDQIIVMENGEIVESGTYSELLKKDGKFSQMIDMQHDDEDEVNHQEEIKTPAGSGGLESEKFTELEEQEEGKVALKVYVDFFKYVGGIGYPAAFIFLIVGTFAISILTPLLLTEWTSSNSMQQLPPYMIFSGIDVLFAALFQIVCLFMALKASCNIHDAALIGLLQAPLYFFHQNPIGRILNRLSSDVQNLDRYTGYQILYFTRTLIAILSNFVLIAISNYYIVGLFLIIGVFTYHWFLLYRPGNLDLQRMYSVSLSPLDAHISETLAGIQVIKAYKQESKFIDIQMELVDKMLAILYTKQSLMVWFKFRVNMMTTLLTLCIVSFGFQTQNHTTEQVSIFALALTRTSSLAEIALLFLMNCGYFEASVRFY